MIKYLPGEKFKPVKIEKSLQLNYAVSNFGRLVSYTKKIKEGSLVKGSNASGYRVMRYKIYSGKKIQYGCVFIHKMVALSFLKKRSAKQVFVIHLDHKKGHDTAANLRWATKEEMVQHSQKSPRVIKARKDLIKQGFTANSKLTPAKVVKLKKQIKNPGRKKTLKEIAQHYGITEMQLHRIKSGENWGHIKS